MPTRTVRLQPQAPSVAACRKILEECIPADASRKFYTAIRRFFIRKFAQWYVSAPPVSSRMRRDIRADEVAKLEKEWTQLAALLSRNPPTMPKHDWQRLPIEPQIARVLRHAWRAVAARNSRGRPGSDLRRQAALALDLQSSDSKRWTWRVLTNHLCNCGLREHPYNSRCQKNLRRETLLVKEFLAKLEVNPPAQRNIR